MDNGDVRVDGNALAGVLSEVFVHEMTTATIKCNGCGETWPLGAEHVYMQAPGIVVRCCRCEGVLFVITEREDTYLIGIQQMGLIEIPRAD